MPNVVIYILLGILTGTVSGIIGIGGGIILVPAFVYLFGMAQHQAQGTTLALMIPPIGLLAAWTYYKHGHVNLAVAGFVCLGFFVGGLFGARMAIVLPSDLLRKIFGIALMLSGIHMVLTKSGV